MTAYEQDPDVVRWGLHQLDICSISNSGAPDTITHYGRDLSRTEYVREGYLGHINMENGEDLFSAEGVREGDYHYSKCIGVENDEVIAHALQEELSRLADAEASGSLCVRDDQCGPILAQNWSGGSSKRHGNDRNQEEEGERGNCCSRSSAGEQSDGERQVCPEIVDESTLDGEVGKRLNQMVPVPHIPKINGEIPSADEQISDHQRLMDRLQLYDLVELKVLGDGNCQFRSLSDQIYRSTDHHEFVREQIVFQLEHHRELYEGYVPMNFDDYLEKISKAGEWGDHVTLQAAADSYGVKIFVITSFKDTCYIEILPQIQKSNRVMCLSFWAEVHYNSIYPQGELPELEIKKKKSWTWLWT